MHLLWHSFCPPPPRPSLTTHHHLPTFLQTGLNVLQYLPAERLEEAIANIAAVVKPGGYFLGDFITSDHVRWYPNVMYGGEGDRVISLRTPRLREREGKMYQESSIVNMDFRGERVFLNDAGTHSRHLPPMSRVRALFERHFGGAVKIMDALSMEELPPDADTCPSTRYVVVAERAPEKGKRRGRGRK